MIVRTSSSTFAPIGGEFQVNTFTANGQSGNVLTSVSDGGFVAVWHSVDQEPIGDFVFGGVGYDVYGQRYDVGGTAVGDEFLVNTKVFGNQFIPSISGLSDGGFVVVWTSLNAKGRHYDLFGQRYGADGAPVGSEFQVNTALQAGTNVTRETEAPASVTGLADGGFVVTWATLDQSDGESFVTHDFNVHGQRYGANGAPVGSEFQVNTETSDNQFSPSITGLSDGGFVVTWHSRDQDGDRFGIFGQRYGADGGAVGAEFQINTFTQGDQQEPSIAALSDGGFVVVWGQQGYLRSDVYGQRYNANGAGVGEEFLINSNAEIRGEDASVIGLSGGGFVVVWRTYESLDNYTIIAQNYGSDGAALGGNFLIKDEIPGYGWPSITELPNGDFVVNWTSLGQDGDGYGIFGQIFVANSSSTGAPVISGSAIQGQVLIADTDSIADSDGLGSFTYAWLRDGTVVPGADGLTYTLTPIDAGSQLAVRVNYTDGLGIEESLTSRNTESVIGDLVLTGDNDDNEFAGDRFNDTLEGKGGKDSLEGKAGDDKLSGGKGDDRLIGGTGNDSLKGGTGSDYLVGSNGKDSLYGGKGDDVLDGGNGADFLDGQIGNDTAVFTGGVDITVNLSKSKAQKTGQGQDTLVSIENVTTGSGNDRLVGNSASNVLIGENGNDTLIGRNSDDILYGNKGKDILSGNSGNDTLYGGNGGDILLGGTGNDVLSGGFGSDTFLFNKGGGSDVIVDFKLGVDLIQFGKGVDRLSQLNFEQVDDDVRISFRDIDITVRDALVATLDDEDIFLF